MSCVLVLALFAVLATVFWIWMLVDCLTNTALEGGNKVAWVLVIFFLHLLGALLYYLIAKPSGGRKSFDGR